LDKNKIIEAAAKLVAKGAYDKAIKEYQKILETDPRDVRILQKMGELFQKRGDSAQAASYFTQVAESYTTDGFFLKAVALFKQVLKLDPSLMEVNIKLAELHQQLQLIGEAMAYFQIVANHYDKAGDHRRSLDVLKKMVDLDPDNVASRVKLADLYVREGLSSEAVAEFTRAAEHLKRNNRVDDYLRVAERLSALEPHNLKLARELAETYLARNDQKRALAKLQVCFKADGRDIETLKLLAVAFQGLGQTTKTLSVYKELARAHEEQGQHGEAEQVWGQVAQLDPQDADLTARSGSRAHQQPPPPPMPTGSTPAYRPGSGVISGVSYPAGSGTFPAASSGSGTSPGLSVGGSSGSRAGKPENVGKLLTETDVYVKYGLHDKALEHLRKVFNLEPENLDAHEKAHAIYVASEDHERAHEQLLNVLRLHTRTGDVVRAQPYLATMLQQDPDHEEVPAFLAALSPSGRPAVEEDPGAEPGLSDDAILVDSSDDEVIVADGAHEAALSPDLPLAAGSQESAEFLGDDVLIQVTGEYHRPPPTPGGHQDEPLWAPPPLEADEAGTGEFPAAGDGDPEAGNELPPGFAVTQPVPAFAARTGRHTLVELPPLGGEEERPTAVSPGAQALAAQDVPEDEWGHERRVPVEEPVVAPPPEDEPASEEIEEAAFFLDQGLLEEAREIVETLLIAYPDHRAAAELLARIELQAGAAPAGEAPAEQPTDHAAAHEGFDLASELAEELGDFAGEPVVEAPSTQDYQVSVEEVFAEFKKGLEKVVKPEDVDTHYDLGVAYKEMDLIDDAVSEFAIARKGCLGKRKEIDCLSMIGLLQHYKGDYPASVEAFSAALASEHARGDVERAIRYDLGATWEAAGQLGRGLAQYLRVQQLDPTFRDVVEHVERLKGLASPEDDSPALTPPAPRGAARKVGYL
jgi:tetratricopeptide (TPR) repeat protein